MSNRLGLDGGQPQKQVRFAPIYTPRWYSGIWTNRAPIRDATTTRIVEKFYGAAGDALIAGSNVEISNKLTLVRRYGTSEYSDNTYTAPDRFYEFRLFNPSTEEIFVMIDQANELYYEYGGTKSSVFSKSTNAGQSYMQSVGNILYFADGVDNKKWLQTLNTWTASQQWGVAGFPMLTTYLIDPNGNIQQLTGTIIPITAIAVSDNVVTVTSSLTLTNLLQSGITFTMPATLTATALEGQVVTISTVSGSTFTFNFDTPDYSGSESTNIIFTNAGTPISGSSAPSWSATVPASGNNFQGGTTQDGSVQWTNRGNPVENWGIQPPTIPLTPVKGQSFSANWAANTFYSIAGVIIDSNGNLQQVTTAGTSGSSAPSWNTTLYDTTTDGTVTWTMIQTASTLAWASGYAYIPPLTITQVAAASGGNAVYTGLIVGGASNGLSGQTFLVTGFADSANNGIYSCSASTATTLTLNNGNAVAEDATDVATAVQQQTVQYVVGNAAGTNCLFKLTPASQPSLSGDVSAYLWAAPHSGPVGSFIMTYPTDTGTALASTTSQNSLQFNGTPLGTGAELEWDVINGAGAVTGTNAPFGLTYTDNYQLVIEATLNVPVAGTYSFSIEHHDGMFWGIGGGATLVSGTNNNPIGQTETAVNGYATFGGSNVSGTNTDTFVVNFPTAGTYPVEINYDYWYHSGQTLEMLCNGQPLANGTPISGATQPAWPGFTTAYAPLYATVTESAGNLVWSNIGPVSDFVWAADAGFTLPNTIITDSNGYSEAPFRSGYSGTTQPTWSTGVYQLTNDNPNLIWINEGGGSSLPTGLLSTFDGGWEYGLALVNSLDNTYSNSTPLSAATGNFTGLKGISFAPGDGLPPLDSIDPQCDYVAIFRTTDGQAVPFLIPGVSVPYTIPLSTYITDGYTDTTQDTGLDNLIEGAIQGENTPPQKGAKNLTFHLNRLWYSVGNVVWWTTGPSAPCGNGINGASPLNYDGMPSLVSRIVPTVSGAMVFTVSDVYIIQGAGTTSSPIQGAVPILPGIGLLSYNALDMNGPTIGLFTTDNQFIILDPSAGTVYAGFPIGDQLRLNNGTPGQSWNPYDVYVAWHVQGEDQAWYLCDGTNGWYRLMSTPAPESGYTWSPFATITGGAGAVQSVEVTPGVHRLLIGPTGTSTILQRDLTVFTDNGTAYAANAVIGSCVLAQPGQVATVAFITTESVRIGTPLNLGIIVDEALPYYSGPFDILKHRENDPPNLRRSQSIYADRFYLDELAEETAVMRHLQIQIMWSPNDTVQNELWSVTVFGAYQQEL